MLDNHSVLSNILSPSIVQGIMCTMGGLGRHIGRQSTDILVDYRSTIGRLSVDNRPVDSRPIVDRYIDRLTADASADM